MSARAADVDRFREKMEKELRTGVVSLVLLLAVDRAGPDYGYRILRNLQEWSGGRLTLKEGTAYPVLQSLERAGLLSSFWGDGDAGPPRKYYQTTAAGRRALEAALDEYRTVSDGVSAILDKTGGPRS